MVVDTQLEYLIRLYHRVGYLTTNDILLFSDRENLSLKDVDRLFEKITAMGIVIFDEVPDANAVQEDDNKIIDEKSIPLQQVAITITRGGYAKRMPLNSYRTQRRGGRGTSMVGQQEDDFVEHMYITSSHDYLLFFTKLGRMYRIKAYEIPEGSRMGMGTPINRILPLDPGEAISHVIPVESMEPERFKRNTCFLQLARA